MTYEELVKQVNNENLYGAVNGYSADFEPKKGIPLQEINAWTYWQGLGVRNPKILVLGQDWGSSKVGINYFEAIDKMITQGISEYDKDVYYFDCIQNFEKGKKDFATDINLAEGLAKLQKNGKQRYPDVVHRRYSDLFFTNLIPGYRKDEKSTGGFKTSWITERVKKEFQDLLNILSPDVVICLGKDTFVRATKIYVRKNPLNKKSWNAYLDSDFKPIKIPLKNGRKEFTFLYPMAHPGYFGTMNRGKDKVDGDWEKLSRWLENKESENMALIEK